MAAYISSVRFGPPKSGRFAIGDTFTDANSYIYECVRAGTPGQWQVLGPVTAAPTTSVTVGAVHGTGVTLVEEGVGTGYHRTTFTVAALPLTISNAVAGTQASGDYIYTFPEGRILVLGTTASIAETTTSTIASTLTAGKTCKFALGTTIGTNATLATTEVDLCPATSITSSATINVAGAAATAALAASAQFDGTAGAKKAYLNFAVPTDLDLAGDATITLSGTVVITWVFLGDF
jgi:hypothetical protein